jgi:hypothetical protein
MKRLWRWLATCPIDPDEPPLDQVGLMIGIKYPCC